MARSRHCRKSGSASILHRIDKTGGVEHFTVRLNQPDGRDNATNHESRASAVNQPERKPL